MDICTINHSTEPGVRLTISFDPTQKAIVCYDDDGEPIVNGINSVSEAVEACKALYKAPEWGLKMIEEEKPMKSWYIIDDLNPMPINAKSEEEAARIMRETWLALSEHDRKERESYYVALCSQDEDGCVDLDSAEQAHDITDADQVMLAHYNTIIDEMTDRYRSVLESDGVCQYQIYIWEDGEIECLCGPNGDNTWLAPNRGEHRKLYYVTTVDAPYVDTYNLSGADPEECSKEETIDFLVDGYREEAEARLDAAIEEASER